jgi:hypothetical protein
MPCHHRLLQRGAINQLASTVIQRRGLRGIDIDFVVVVGQSLSPLFLSRPGRREAAGVVTLADFISRSP